MRIHTLIFLILSSVNAWSEGLGYVRASSFASRGLSKACYSMSSFSWGLPCNPAFTAFERPRQFEGQFFLGNNISYANEVSDLLNGDGDAKSVNKIFNKDQKQSNMEAFLEVSYLQENFAISYSPYRVFYSTYQRNRSLPKITALLGSEQSLQAQIGSFFGKDFFWGLQARGVQRKFISADFYLTEAFVEGGDELFTVKKQNALYLEPSLVWSVEGDYKPQASIMMVNSGFVDYKYDEFAMRPEWLVGFSLFPVQWYSQSLELALQAHFNDEQKTTSEFFTLAANYSFSALQIFGSLSENIYTSGFRVVYKQFSTGLSYWNERLDYIKDQKVYQQTVYIQLGFLL